MTELEGYEILRKPFIRTGEIGKLIGVTSNQASKIATKLKIRKIERGSYITADAVKKLGLESYWKQVSRFAPTVE